jgi:hypothetical protein
MMIDGAGIRMHSTTSTIRAPKSARPGRRGAGSKPARERSTAEFSAAFKQASSDNGYARTARRTNRERLKLQYEADGTAQAKRDALEAAKQAWRDNVAIHEQKQLVRRHEKAMDFVKRHLSLQPAHERIHQGFKWPGGWVIENEVWRDEFVETGLRTWRHPFYQRVLASMGKASTTLCAGDTKDGCVRQFSKLHGSDKLYGFFSVKCRDMWRLDCDRTFANEAEMLSWLAFRVMESGAPCMPHMAVWIPDDRYPGVIKKPHFYFLLPEGRAVWPTAPESHHRLLRAVIEALTAAFECDLGGLAHPFHGKIPLSPFTGVSIVQDTCMPALDEYADHMKLSWAAAEVAFRKMSVDRLEEAGFDRAQSNTWFSVPSTLANTVARDLYRQGFAVADEDAFETAVAEAITPEVLNLVKPSTAKQTKTIENMIAGCARWTVRTFDPAKIDSKPKDRGAIAHLIEPTDDLKTKQRKGQTYVAEKRTAATQAVLKPVYADRRKRGARLDRTTVAKATDRAYNTIKRHEFEVTVTVIAEQLVALCSLVAVKEVHPDLQPKILPSDPPFGHPSAPRSGLPPPPDLGSGPNVLVSSL